MGQKTNPNGLRLGIIRTWESKWYAGKNDVPALVKEDAMIREFLSTNFKKAGVSQIEIERVKAKNKERVTVKLYVAKPGIALGKEGAEKNTINEIKVGGVALTPDANRSVNITQISTDLLVTGKNVLVLDCGSASLN